MIEPLRERKVLDIKGCKIGEGPSKAIISVMGANLQECLDVIEEGKANGVQMFEWRGDFHDDRHDPAKMVEDGRAIAAAVPEHPLLFTFRSTSQGGQDSFSAEEYVALNKALIEAEILDIVDIETWIGDDYMIELINLAHEHGVYAMPSYHNFRGTPSVEWMIGLMEHMWDLGADIAKCATMAKNFGDALRLIQATYEVGELYANGPMLTMAMGREGSISRLAGEYYGNDITFCALRASSAPGQVGVVQARRIMDELHEVLS